MQSKLRYEYAYPPTYVDFVRDIVHTVEGDIISIEDYLRNSEDIEEIDNT